MATFEYNTPIHVGDVRGTGRKAKEDAMCNTVNTILGKSRTFSAKEMPQDTYVNKFEWTIDGDFDWAVLTALKSVFSTAECVGNTLTINKEDALFDQSMISQNLIKNNNKQTLIINSIILIILAALMYFWYNQ